MRHQFRLLQRQLPYQRQMLEMSGRLCPKREPMLLLPHRARYHGARVQTNGYRAWSVFPVRAGWSQVCDVVDRSRWREVHDATNLFSSSTPQPKTADPNGYIALAMYDLASEGGNNNGWIDAGDKIYSRLRVWIDANQDGEAQSGELHRLDELGIKRIGLRYHLAEKVDQYGNVFRYVSQVLDESDPKAYDVWVKLDPDATKP